MTRFASSFSTAPTFVVGPSRSGTTLLSGCINACTDIHIAEETHYFDDLRPRLANPGSGHLPDADREIAEDYFLALSHRLYGQGGDPARGSLPRAELRERAEALGGSADAHFEAFCRYRAEEAGRQRWGEKTPRHVFRLDEIRERYPEARIVCMIRDPRAVVASYRDFRKGNAEEDPGDPDRESALEIEQRRVRLSYHVIIASLMWRSVAGACIAAQERLGEEVVRIVRYEDFVADAEATLSDLADWLDTSFDARQLATVPIGTSSYHTGVQSDAGVITGAVDRWRTQMSVAEIHAVERCTAGRLDAYGYERAKVRVGFFEGLTPWLTLPAALVAATWANRNRIGGLPSYLWRRFRAAL